MSKPLPRINVTWTQPYLPVSYNPFYTPSSVSLEMARLEQVDRAVEAMTEYPDAVKIISAIQSRQ